MRQFSMGKKIGKYRVIDQLGSGGMGTVYLVEDLDLERQVAIKVLHPNLASDTIFMERFKAEARSVAKLLHPNIVPVNALTYEDDQLIIEMPFFAGGSLHDLLTLDDRRFVDIVPCCVHILDALDACHSHDLVHRDVKPSNILRDRNGRVLLGDFGLAKAVGETLQHDRSEMTASSMFIGTPRYAPLEAWEDQEPTPAWDLFSIGVMLYEGLSGRSPFTEGSPLTHLRSLEKDDVVPLRRIHNANSPEIETLVSELLSNDLKERPNDACAVKERLMKTSEYAKITSPENTISYAIPTGFSRKKNRWKKKLRDILHKAFPWSGWLIVPVFLLLLFLLPYNLNGTVQPSDRPAPLFQEEAFTAVDTAHSALLDMQRFPAASQAKIMTSLHSADDTASMEHWLLVDAEDSDEKQVIAYAANRICYLHLQSQGNDQLEITGIWGAYRDLSTLECLSGNVTGSGKWFADQSILNCELEFESVTLGVTLRESQTLCQNVGSTDSAMLWRLEEDAILMPLLKNELLPRDPSWWECLDVFFPAIAHAIIPAAPVSPTMPPIVLDGLLDDPVWEIRRLQDHTFALGRPTNIRPKLFASVSASGIYLALQAETALPEDALLTVTFLNSYYVPTIDSPRFFLTFQQDRLINGSTADGNDLPAWIQESRMAIASTEEAWTCELFLPTETLNAGEASLSSTYWRVNVVVREANDASPRLRWGAPDEQDVFHGCLIIGESVNPPQPEE